MTISHAAARTTTPTSDPWWRRPGWVRVWPVVTAVVFALVVAPTDVTGSSVLLALLPALYAAVLLSGRRGRTWLVVLGGVALFTLGSAVADPFTVQLVTTAVAGVVLASAHARGARHEVVRQTVGVVVFAGVALLAWFVDPVVAGWTVAVGWLGHGAWDLWHLHRDAVVSRTFATWCGVVDVLVGAQLVVGLVRA